MKQLNAIPLFRMLKRRMKSLDHSRFLSYLLLILMGVPLGACAVFDPVGDFLSRGYENTVSYFNAYYNAQRLFSEAEDAIKAAEIANRGRTIAPGQANQIPADAKQKLSLVIDKCSNILSFHSSSGLVDDALFLIGRSYYYQAEYLKAERKFSELLSQYSKSSFSPEGQWWYARTLMQEKKYDEAIQSCDRLIALASDQHDADLESRAEFLEGSVYRSLNQLDKAEEHYMKAAGVAEDEQLRNTAETTLGDVLEARGEYEKADSVYFDAANYTKDIYHIYYDRFHAGLSAREARNTELAARTFDALFQDFRMKEYLPIIRLERARTLAAMGRRDEAMEEYRLIDTTYARSEIGLQASYELGIILEKDFGDYVAARSYYLRSSLLQGFQVSADGLRKYNALNRYFAAHKALARYDSLLTVGSQTTVDSVQPARRDSVVADSSKASVKIAKLNADSLKILRALAAQDLGEVFYSEIDVPDSAYAWYNVALSVSDSVRTPRMLYILAELARAHPEKPFTKSEEQYHRLVAEYPDSPYASQARKFLGLAEVRQTADPAEVLYARADSMVQAKRWDQSLAQFSSIVQSFPHSPYAAKSEYAIGWVYEHYLNSPDSAVAHYRMLTQKYATTRYALAVQTTMSGIPGAAPPDSSVKKSVIPPSPNKAKNPDRELEEVPPSKVPPAGEKPRKKDD